MLRLSSHLIAAGAVAVSVAAPTVGLAAPGVGTSATPVASVKVVECLRGPLTRSVEFRGSMRRVAGTRRMWMRFGLEERVGDGSFSSVAAPQLGVWRKSRVGVQRFSYRQGVVELAPGSAYRTTVHYRWYGSGGRVVRRAQRRSGACAQPGLLPNLRVARIASRPIGNGSPRLARYTVFVANRGRAASNPTKVALAVDGATVDTVPLSALAPGQEARVFVNGPLCTNTVEARVDPGDNEREGSEGDNARSVACPSAE